MSSRIVIVDRICTHRIRYAGELGAAHFDTACANSTAAARPLILSQPTSLVLLDFTDFIGASTLCRDLRAHPETRSMPIIATGRFVNFAARLAALHAGADDVHPTTSPTPLLLARIRAHLRAFDRTTDLQPRHEMRQALGFAEDETEIAANGRILVVSDRPHDLPRSLGDLCDTFTGSCVISHPESPETLAHMATRPDLLVLDAGGPSHRTDSGADRGGLFRLIAEIRSARDTRFAGVLVLVPPGAPDMAIMALDLGASDLVTSDVSTEEMVFRARSLMTRKAREDQFRDTVRSGLQAAVTDPLTGLFNRRYALPHLGRMVERARQAGDRTIAVMVLDIDHFKAINDLHGHAVGDRVLAGVAERLRGRLRADDLLARIGGEEFLVVLPDTTPEAAEVTAERLRQEIGGRPFAATGNVRPLNRGQPRTVDVGPTGLEVTVSIGVALGPDQAGGDHLFARADAALYAAKAGGRNMVSLHSTAA